MSDVSLTAIKLGFLGDSSVGKTAICNSFMGIEFAQEMISTIGSDKLETKMVLKNGKKVKVVLWDTAGQERFQSIALNAVKSAHGIVVVFDLTNRESFENVSSWLEKIKDNSSNCALVLFGNKADLPQDMWKVTLDEAQEFAKKMNIKYFETSAKTKQGIDDGFSYIANESFEKLSKKMGGIKIGEKDDDEYEVVDGCFGKKRRKKKKKNTSK